MDRRRTLACLALLTVSAAAVAQQVPANPHGEARAERDARATIEKLEAQLNAAVVKGDLEFFDQIFAEDFTHTSHAGVFRTKAQWMANHRREAGKPAPSPYDAFDVDELSVRVYGDTAVVTGRSTPKGRDSKGEAINGRYRFTRVWVKRSGKWQVVAFQGTRIGTQ